MAQPDRIRSLTEFRAATLLLGASLITPVMVQLLFYGRAVPRQPGPDAGLAVYSIALTPLLSTLALILGVDSVTPRSRSLNQKDF